MIRRALLLIGILAGGCERARESDPAATTKSFFANLETGNLDAAFDESAFYFQREQTRREFAATAHDLGLVGCTLANAEPATIAGKLAKQLVEICSRSGARFPLVVTLSRDRGAWRVFSVKSPVDIETGISKNFFTRIGNGPDLVSAQDRPVPDEREILAMAKETMLRFHDAVQQKSFEDFYENIARSWQRQLPLGMLTRTFQGFIDQRTNLIAIKDLEATLNEPPRLDFEGLLVVAGSYATQPHRIDFELKYFYEVPNWRPFGVTIRLIK